MFRYGIANGMRSTCALKSTVLRTVRSKNGRRYVALAVSEKSQVFWVDRDRSWKQWRDS